MKTDAYRDQVVIVKEASAGIGRLLANQGAKLAVASVGSLLIYFTGTTVKFACFAPLMFVRVWREERILSAEFGEQWKEYCKQVPATIPCWRKERHEQS